MMARSGVTHFHKSILAVLAVFLLAIAQPVSFAHAAEAAGGEVTDGDSFVAALGGQAAWATEGDVCVVTLGGDVELSNTVLVNAGSYRIVGEGTVSRVDGFSAHLFKVASGASLELSGSVVLDGGAVWVKDGERVDSAVGATNEGLSTGASMIDDLGGTVVVSGDAALRNNCGAAAVYMQRGSVCVRGGSLYGNRGNNDFPGAIHADGGTVEVSGGELWGNEGGPSASGSAVSCWSSAQVSVSGGTVRGNGGPVAVSAYALTVTGGSFEGNLGAALGRCSGSASLSGGSFSGNAGGAFANASGSSVPLQLQGSPAFGSESDVIIGEIKVVDKLTGSDVYVDPANGDVGTVVARGSDAYTLTEEDAAKFALGESWSRGWYLDFDSQDNQIVLAYAVPVTLEAQVSDEIVFDGEAVEPGIDFTLKVFSYADDVKGDDITANYAVGGGSVAVSYRYRDEGSAGYTMGLPSEPGTYEVQAIAAADKDGGYSSGTVQFALTISDVFVVTFTDGQGNELSIQQVVSGAAAQAPADPVREGFTFKGWDIDFSSVSSNLLVTALWEEISGSGGDGQDVKPVPEDASLKANPMVAKAKKTVAVKAAKVAKKAVKIARKKAIAVSKAKGKVTYKLVSVKKAKFKKYFKVAKKTGKITVKKGLKRGTYKLRVAVSAAGDASYKAKTKVVTVKVKVK